MRKTFKFKLYNSKQNKYLHGKIDIASQIYNCCISLHKLYYKRFGIKLNKYDLQSHLAWLKRTKKFNHWKKLGSQAIQDIPDRIDRAYNLFFKSLNKSKKTSPPSFKKMKKYKSFTLKQAGFKLLDRNKIKINGRIYKYFKSREIEGKIATLTVKRDLVGDIYLFFSCSFEDVHMNRVMTGKKAGFDFGLKTFLTPSDDSSSIISPLFFKQNLKTIKVINKKFSRKIKGSSNWKRTKLDLERAHKKIVNKRTDFQFKTALKVAGKYDLVCFEKLNIDAMKKEWGRKISDLAFSNYLSIQEHCCKKKGSIFKQTDRFFSSSKLCNVCGSKNKELKLRDRHWTCLSCKTNHHRDKNAAINILREGASSLNLGGVRPTKLASSA